MTADDRTPAAGVPDPGPANVAGVLDPGSASPTPPSTPAHRPKCIAWVLGWAIPEPWFATLAHAAFPEAQHHFFVPSPSVIDTVEAAGPFDVIYGYSLGSLLLLLNAARVSQLGRVDLLAPIFAFPREDALGGRVSRTQVRQLARWLPRDPAAALTDFYHRAGLGIECRAGSPHPAVAECIPEFTPNDFASIDRQSVAPLPSPVPCLLSPPDLLWGLARLEQDRVIPSLPPTWSAYVGENDALLDATQLHALDPRIEIVPQATHHPAALIRASARITPSQNNSI